MFFLLIWRTVLLKGKTYLSKNETNINRRNIILVSSKYKQKKNKRRNN